MSLAGRDTSATLERLEAALDGPGVPTKAVAGCRSLIAKLRRPVTLGLFGLPGSGKSMILNALAGQAVVPADLSLPTLEITHGPELRLTAMLEDGSTITRPGLPGPDLLDEEPIFIRATSPEETLQGLSVLNVVAEEHADDLEAALLWGAQRCDIALWCTRSWTEFEQGIWRRAPHQLKNHALMIVTRDARRARIKTAPEDCFEKVLNAPPLKVFGLSGVAARLRADDLDRVLGEVQQVIDEAIAEDVDSALMFLHRYEPEAKKSSIFRTATTPVEESSDSLGLQVDAPEPNPEAVISEPSAECLHETVEPKGAVAPIPLPVGKHASDVSPEATAALSRAFHYLRQRGGELLDRLPTDPLTPEMAEDLLAQFEDAIVSLVAFTEFELAFADTWPDLHDAILAANEIALLLRIEGGVEQVGEAAALMLQLRQELELELAA